jgi:4-hydroxyphenylacetate 3-monooxygenase
MQANGQRTGPYCAPDRPPALFGPDADQLYPKVITAITDLAGGGLVMQSLGVADFDNPLLADLTQKSPPLHAAEPGEIVQARLGCEGGASRQIQYEMFYAGDIVRHPRAPYRTFDWAQCAGMVDHHGAPSHARTHNRRDSCGRVIDSFLFPLSAQLCGGYVCKSPLIVRTS